MMVQNFLIIIILILYISADLTLIASGQTFLLKNIISYIRLNRWAKENIPNTWSYKINFITLTSDQFYIKCTKKDDGKWTNDHMKHKWGRVKGNRILDNMRFYDSNFDNEIKRMKRESKIECLLN